MTQDEIRDLEVKAAIAMGWTCREDPGDGLMYWRPPGEYCAWRDNPPLFARYDGATLQALEWLLRSSLKFPDKPSLQFFPDGGPEVFGYEGETIGIAVCRAIAALSK